MADALIYSKSVEILNVVDLHILINQLIKRQ